MPIITKDKYYQNWNSAGWTATTDIITNDDWSILSNGTDPTLTANNDANIGDCSVMSTVSTKWYTALKNGLTTPINFELSARMKYSGDRAILYFRVFDPSAYGPNNGTVNGGYRLMVGTGTNYIQMTRYNGNGTSAGLVTETFPGSFSPTDFNFRIRVRGANIQAFIDDINFVDYTDSSPILKPGTIGFGTYSTTLYTTDLSVTSL